MTGFAVVTALGLRKPGSDDFDLAKVTQIVHIYSSGSLAAMLRENWLEWVQELRSQLFSVIALSLFLLGLWVARAGVLDHLADYKPLFRRICWVCLPLGLAWNFGEALISANFPAPPRPVWIVWADNMSSLYSGPLLAAGYAAGLALLLQSPGWRRALTPFAAVGRTALTNYLSQSIVCVAFFRLTHLYGVWGPAWDLVPTVVLFGVQVLVSNWWLHRFRFGPMEWLWRGMTYGSFPKAREARGGLEARPGVFPKDGSQAV
jgi:uncharacterized protein